MKKYTPGFYKLPESINKLRETALERQMQPPKNYNYTTIDAKTWAAHTEGEGWLIWRARWASERMKNMPLETLPGELIVGRPAHLEPSEQELEQTRQTLSTMPPISGGDQGHFHPDYQKLFTLGVRGIITEIQQKRTQTADPDKITFYNACEIAMNGFTQYCLNAAESAQQAGNKEAAEVCRSIAVNPPTTFREAIQLMYLTIVALTFGEDHYLTNPGRMDQTLYPHYKNDLEAGRITPEEALDLISSLYIQMNMIVQAGLAISVLVGGRDERGKDVTNQLTYLCLEARLATRLVYPTVGICWHEGTPEALTEYGCLAIATGIGDPAYFNDQLIAEGLRDHGVSIPDSYNYMNSTCVEIKVAAACNIWVASPYYNLPKNLLETLAEEPSTFDELNQKAKQNIAAKIKKEAEELDRAWKGRYHTGCFPFASCLTKDCIERGLDFDRGGPRYHWVENSMVGLANLADSLIAIKKLVYENKEITLAELSEALQADYRGHEPLLRRIQATIPKYGTDTDEVDAIASEWADYLQTTTETNIIGGHRYVPGFFCWIMHEKLGSETGATPDGRRAGQAFSDGAGAAQGREKAGPTASVLSTTKWSHKRALGGLVQNMKFSKTSLKDQAGIMALKAIIETYLKRGGFEIQINTVDAQELRQAQKHPEKYADLVVRVAGYSDYFTHLNPGMQEEVIARTQHDTCCG